MLELSAERRFPPLPRIWKLPRFAVAAFLDGADVTDTWDELGSAELHWATGGGLRVPTPIGAVRFDVGYRLNRKAATDPRPGESFAYHLSVGEAF
jgi:outer membrane protein insertion porin family